jgi:uncharacterized protein YcbX
VDVGTLVSIWRYPVKSLGGESLQSVAVERSGIPGDRGSALFVRHGHVREGKTYRGKENDRLHLTGDVGAALELGAARGVELERRGGEHFFDDAPISILIDRWMVEMNAALRYEVEPERFRSNFFVVSDASFASTEAELVGAVLSLGEVKLRVRCPIERCVAITYDLHGAPSDPAILRYIAQSRNALMGIYCDVVQTGNVRVGDRLARPEPA